MRTQANEVAKIYMINDLQKNKRSFKTTLAGWLHRLVDQIKGHTEM